MPWREDPTLPQNHVSRGGLATYLAPRVLRPTPKTVMPQGPEDGHVGELSNDLLQSSSCFPLISGARLDNPVMFPPGRARLATKPEPTGSLSNPMTTGIVTVASLAARVTVPPAVTMTSTLRLTNSAMSAESQSSFPSANRHSITMFFPSTY